MLGIGHEGDGHDLAVDADQLTFGEVLAVLGDEIVQRTHQAGIQERHDGVVGDHRDRVGRRIGGERRNLDILVLRRWFFDTFTVGLAHSSAVRATT
jgi:hypothetical protein